MAGLPVLGGLLLRGALLAGPQLARLGWLVVALLRGLLGRIEPVWPLGERGGFAAARGLLDAGVKEGGGLADLEGVAGVSDPEPRSLQTGYD